MYKICSEPLARNIWESLSWLSGLCLSLSDVFEDDVQISEEKIKINVHRTSLSWSWPDAHWKMISGNSIWELNKLLKQEFFRRSRTYNLMSISKSPRYPRKFPTVHGKFLAMLIFTLILTIFLIMVWSN